MGTVKVLWMNGLPPLCNLELQRSSLSYFLCGLTSLLLLWPRVGKTKTYSSCEMHLRVTAIDDKRPILSDMFLTDCGRKKACLKFWNDGSSIMGVLWFGYKRHQMESFILN